MQMWVGFWGDRIGKGCGFVILLYLCLTLSALDISFNVFSVMLFTIKAGSQFHSANFLEGKTKF